MVLLPLPLSMYLPTRRCQFVAFLRPEQISSGDFELEEDQAHRLFEARGETKTVVEMRELFADIDVDKNHKLSFLEWCCGAFKLSWAELHAGVVVDEAKCECTTLCTRPASNAWCDSRLTHHGCA